MGAVAARSVGVGVRMGGRRHGLGIAALCALAANVGAGLVRDSILAAGAGAVMRAVIVRGVGVGVRMGGRRYGLGIAALFAHAANVGAGLVRDGILAAGASAVVGAVIVRGVGVGVLVLNESLFESNLYDRVVAGHGKGVLAIHSG